MASTLLTKAFWEATAERAVKTFAQTAVAVGLIGATGLIGVDWLNVASVAGLAALVSVLTSVGSDAATGGGPSLTTERIDGI